MDEPLLMIDYTLNAGCTLTSAAACERYVHQNRLGSVVAVTDSAGAVVETYRYSPYGVSGAEGNAGFPFRFTGQKLDPETGLYYYKARYYDPETGRFLQTDPIGYEDQMNLYAYVANDPVNNYDPGGEICLAANFYSQFCKRSRRFNAVDRDPKIRSKTNFFRGAGIVAAALASGDLPGSRMAISPDTQRWLRGASSRLEIATTRRADQIREGTLYGGSTSIRENDREFVRFEQNLVQQELDSLKASNPTRYDAITSDINSSFNGGAGVGRGMDPTFNRALIKTKNELGGEFDFGNKDHRIKLGDNILDLVSRQRQCTGTRLC